MRNKLTASVIAGLAITLCAVWLVFLFTGGGEGFISRVFVAQRRAINIRMPAVAGSFYPSHREELSAQLDSLLARATTTPLSDHIRVMVVPHAGYEYSGGTAAYAYKALAANRNDDRGAPTVILIGSGHRVNVNGAAIDSHDAWQTPLGKVPIDAKIRDILVASNALFHIDANAHKEEHSLEVQVSFLQKILPQFSLVPILVNSATDEEKNRISAAIAALPGDVVIIASTDLSHYPSYEEAIAVDAKAIDAMMSGNAEKVRSTIAQLESSRTPALVTFMCAQPAVEIALKAAQLWGADGSQLLAYANSGDSRAGDPSRVVGYAAIVFASARKGSELIPQEQEELLNIARTTAEAYVKQTLIPPLRSDPFFLNQKRGAFVTIKKRGVLRGCIGHFMPQEPLYQIVSQMAVAAATKDARFPPIAPEELDELTYEVSVLSPLRIIKDWREIEVGTHGVRVRVGSKEGVFLPQVASENNWGLEEFMGELCSQKMGMARDCWKGPHAELSVFTAQVFGE